jgi:hypothetical protein
MPALGRAEYFRLDLLLTAIGFPPGGSVQYTPDDSAIVNA